jgi:alpha-tubulin suppressor-like RCC1 family protein
MKPNISCSIAAAMLFAVGCIASPPGSNNQAPDDGGADAGPVSDTSNNTSTDGSTTDGAVTDAYTGDADACVPSTCEELQACGTIDDGCGTRLECSPCMEPDRIVVFPDPITVLVGEELELQSHVFDTDNNQIPDAAITWAVDDEGVIGLSQDGVVTGRATGQTTIAASADGVDSVTIDVTVEETFSAVDAGHTHTCALTASGRAYCWGNGHTLAVGRPPGTYRTPQRIDFGNRQYAEIAVGQDHSCAISMDRTKVRCWGKEDHGQLGGLGMDRINSVEVDLGVAGEYREITAGLFHTCVIAENNEPVCWGQNDHGQSSPDAGDDPASPTTVALPESATSLAAGWKYTCAIAETTQYCWGDDANGQFGDGDNANGPEVTDVEISYESAPQELSMMAAFDGHTCALTSGGTVLCWGYNESGAVDPMLDNPVASPVGRYEDNEYDHVDVGSRHSCAAMATSLQCWGSNSEDDGNRDVTGLLGTDDPMVVSNLIDFNEEIEEIALGWFHSCVLLTDGTIHCWGDNQDGQLGDGTTDDSSSPVRVTME